MAHFLKILCSLFLITMHGYVFGSYKKIAAMQFKQIVGLTAKQAIENQGQPQKFLIYRSDHLSNHDVIAQVINHKNQYCLHDERSLSLQWDISIDEDPRSVVIIAKQQQE